MSYTANDLDMRATIARIDQTQAATHKLVAETINLNAETSKLVSEQAKLIAEEMKLRRDRGLAPWLAYVGIVGGIVTILGALARLLGY